MDNMMLSNMEVNTMGITHLNADPGAESDQFREILQMYDTFITKDDHDVQNNMTTIEYITGEDDAPFVKYRLTLEPISLHSEDEFESLKEQAKKMAE
jgi:hypothetical protein